MATKGIIFSAPMVRALLEGRKTQTRRLLTPKPIPAATSVQLVGKVAATGRPAFNFLDAGGDPIYALPTKHGLAGEYDAPYAPADRLYVRESGIELPGTPGGAGDLFRHDEPIEPHRGIYWSRNNGGPGASYALPACTREGAKASPRAKVRPSIHMPRWASRLWLEVTDVRVQRLRDISDDDAQAEGVVWQEPTAEDFEWAKGFAEENGGSVDMQGVWTVPDAKGFTKADVWGCKPSDCFHYLWNALHTAEGERWEDNPWIVAVSFGVHHGNVDQVQS